MVACAKKIMNDRGLVIEKYVLIADLGITKMPTPLFRQSDVQTVVDAVRSP